ncbi:MAG: P27 family phage terminase small subunit [Syntrophales bacterium]|jgi:hypothetical protein|nr:P27 family phage terminase small subunit [Syntrophales bacterium]MCK9527209.1 P27 family phage terminase small subunit [Syntrophales bacterium]MDX9921321.1 hypothetical protein [Syntrophales bacterium]
MKIHKRAEQFRRQALAEYIFNDAELSFFDGVVQALSNYWRAADILKREGITVTGGSMVRKHPAFEVSKIAWSQFIGGCKHLGICTPTPDEKRPYGTGP